MKRTAYPALALLLLPAATGFVLFGTPQHLDVQVIGMADATLSDRITVLDVTVHNPGPLDVRPNIAVPSSALRNWYSWPVTQGPAVLAAGTQATYRVTQPAYTGVPISEGFSVVVMDAHDARIRGVSPIVHASRDHLLPAVLNPTFHDWAPSMFYPDALPYGWVPWLDLHGGDVANVTGRDGSVTLSLELDTTRRPRGDDPANIPFGLAADRRSSSQWSMVSLRQRIDFPRTLRIDLEDGDRGTFSGGARTEVGVLLEDVAGRTQLMVLFSGGPTDPDQHGELDLSFPTYDAHRILVTNRSIDLDLEPLYERLGWHIPALQQVPRLLPHGPGDVGMGSAAVLEGADQMEVSRPVELKLFVASYPPHEHAHLRATFSFVGGPALDPALSRLASAP